MAGLLTKLVLLAALGMPLIAALLSLPGLTSWQGDDRPASARLFALSGAGIDQVAVPTAFSTTRYAPLDAPPPPTLGIPTRVPPTPAPSAPREHVAIYNTGGLGAAVRAQPGQSQPVAGLREGDVVEVLERSRLGTAEWVKVRTSQGAEGWIIGTVARTVQGTPAPATIPPPGARLTPPPSRTRTAGSGDRTHTVQPGDELRHIAASFGVSMADIMAVNEIPNPDSLTVGQVLSIPG